MVQLVNCVHNKILLYQSCVKNIKNLLPRPQYQCKYNLILKSKTAKPRMLVWLNCFCNENQWYMTICKQHLTELVTLTLNTI